jgi:hypothetical protein
LSRKLRRRGLSEFLAVSSPAVRGKIVVALTLPIVAALRTFALVYILAPGGGPINSTTAPSYEVYYRSFERAQVGTGVTIAQLLNAVILLLSVLVNRFAERAQCRRRHWSDSSPASCWGPRRRFAVFPMLLIVRTALEPDAIGEEGSFAVGNVATAWPEGRIGDYVTTSVIVAGTVMAASCCSA